MGDRALDWIHFFRASPWSTKWFSVGEDSLYPWVRYQLPSLPKFLCPFDHLNIGSGVISLNFQGHLVFLWVKWRFDENRINGWFYKTNFFLQFLAILAPAAISNHKMMNETPPWIQRYILSMNIVTTCDLHRCFQAARKISILVLADYLKKWS